MISFSVTSYEAWRDKLLRSLVIWWDAPLSYINGFEVFLYGLGWIGISKRKDIPSFYWSSSAGDKSMIMEERDTFHFIYCQSFHSFTPCLQWTQSNSTLFVRTSILLNHIQRPLIYSYSSNSTTKVIEDKL